MRLKFVTALVVAVALAALPATAPAWSGQEKPASSQTTATQLVNINTAPVDQLERLPGVGPKTAARIVEYRQKNGGFKKIEELMNVRGIGEKAFLKMKSQLTVTAPKADPQ